MVDDYKIYALDVDDKPRMLLNPDRQDKIARANGMSWAYFLGIFDGQILELDQQHKIIEQDDE